jgi:hypothetical protein
MNSIPFAPNVKPSLPDNLVPTLTTCECKNASVVVKSRKYLVGMECSWLLFSGQKYKVCEYNVAVISHMEGPLQHKSSTCLYIRRKRDAILVGGQVITDAIHTEIEVGVSLLRDVTSPSPRSILHEVVHHNATNSASVGHVRNAVHHVQHDVVQNCNNETGSRPCSEACDIHQYSNAHEEL